MKAYHYALVQIVESQSPVCQTKKISVLKVLYVKTEQEAKTLKQEAST